MRALESNDYGLANQVYGILGHGGGLVSPSGIDFPTSGYFVSVVEGPTYKRLQDVSVIELTQWIRKNIKGSNPDVFIGAWRDDETREIITHIGRHEAEIHNAISLAKMISIDAIYDVEHGKTLFINDLEVAE
jgi:hypothetical protein